MDLVLLMLFFCSLYRVAPQVDWTLCVGREERDGGIEIAVYKKNRSAVLTEDHQSVCEIDGLEFFIFCL